MLAEADFTFEFKDPGNIPNPMMSIDGASFGYQVEDEAPKVILTGVSTECCVDSTARRAFHLDYDVMIVSDACAASTPALHTSALAGLERNVALLVESGTAITALARHG